MLEILRSIRGVGGRECWFGKEGSGVGKYDEGEGAQIKRLSRKQKEQLVGSANDSMMMFLWLKK